MYSSQKKIMELKKIKETENYGKKSFTLTKSYKHSSL